MSLSENLEDAESDRLYDAVYDIREALRDHYHDRDHSCAMGPSQTRLVEKIERIFGMTWRQGEETKRREMMQ